MSREALVLLVCCCDFRDGAERLIPSKSLRNAVIWAFPGLLCILRMCAPRRAAAVVRPRGREKSADRRRRILISRLLIIRASVPRRKSPFPAYFKGFPAVSPLIPPYPAFLKYPVSPHQPFSILVPYRNGIRRSNDVQNLPLHNARYHAAAQSSMPDLHPYCCIWLLYFYRQGLQNGNVRSNFRDSAALPKPERLLLYCNSAPRGPSFLSSQTPSENQRGSQI